MRVDLLTLYALSDKTHAKQRELWRGFLALVMPVLLECDASEFERILESAQCRSLETMLGSLDAPAEESQLIWTVSGNFAELLGLESELGLAAFLDVNLPTRMHAVAGAQNIVNENVIVSRWLRAFRELQQRPEFLEITAEWKRAFEIYLEGDNSEASEREDAQEKSSAADSETSKNPASGKTPKTA